jgi:cobalt-zinc-cadmium efflux system protein
LGHHHHHPGSGKILQWSSLATISFVAIEAYFGFRSGSLALISDAGHNFTDALALVLAAIGVYLQSKPANEVKTFGYHRAGVLAAFVNALTLVLMAGFIFWEAWQRLWRPEPVQEWTMLGVACAGLLLNLSVMFGLRGEKDHDINVRAAFVHMLGDALSSVAIVAGALLIHFTGWRQIDPALSLIIGGLIVYTAWDIILESLNVLLEGLPRGIHLSRVVESLAQVDGVVDVHDLHIWSLGSHAHALSCHVLIEDMPPSASESILRQMNDVLCGFKIHHTTIQFEHTRCALSDSGCSIPLASAHAHHHEH